MQGTRQATDVWVYRDTTLATTMRNADVVGYDVEALDGSIGEVDDATLETGSGYLVVDTGPWIFGKKVLLPAGVIDRVDREAEKIFVNRTKDEIKNAPELDEKLIHDDAYRTRLGSYYGRGGAGYRG